MDIGYACICDKMQKLGAGCLSKSGQIALLCEMFDEFDKTFFFLM